MTHHEKPRLPDRGAGRIANMRAREIIRIPAACFIRIARIICLWLFWQLDRRSKGRITCKDPVPRGWIPQTPGLSNIWEADQDEKQEECLKRFLTPIFLAQHANSPNTDISARNYLKKDSQQIVG